MKSMTPVYGLRILYEPRSLSLNCYSLKVIIAEQYEAIGHKETHRLAYQPGSYTVLIYKRPVVRHKNKYSFNV